MSSAFDILTEEPRGLLQSEGFPRWLDPMLATLADHAFSDEDWLYERKLDGERVLAYRSGDGVQLLSRNQRQLADTYPELLQPLERAAAVDYVADGEVVAFHGDLTSFERLQARMQVRERDEARASDVPVFFYVFDLLHLDGHSTRRIPLGERKQLLREALSFDDPIRFTTYRNEDGEDWYEEACASGWEGLIAKDSTAPYVGSRSRKWLKFKCVNRQEFVVGGYTDPQGERSHFGSLLIGYQEDDELVYAGKVGTGYDEGTLESLASRMSELERKEPPFESGDPPSKGSHWVDPELVVEVGFTEWTRHGKLRHPRYVGIRCDKSPKEVVREAS